jgi:hypothetical protein
MANVRTLTITDREVRQMGVHSTNNEQLKTMLLRAGFTLNAPIIRYRMANIAAYFYEQIIPRSPDEADYLPPSVNTRVFETVCLRPSQGIPPSLGRPEPPSLSCDFCGSLVPPDQAWVSERLTACDACHERRKESPHESR